jgi:glutaredoxin
MTLLSFWQRYSSTILIFLAAFFATGLVTYVFKQPHLFSFEKTVETGDWPLVLQEDNLPDVVMFGIPTCPACEKAKSFLEMHCISFQYRNPSTSEKHMDSFSKLGGEEVPVLIIGSKKITGFHPTKIINTLKEEKILRKNELHSCNEVG